MTSLADGKSVPVIAVELGLSRSTVKSYIERACDRLDARGQTALVVAALRARLIE